MQNRDELHKPQNLFEVTQWLWNLYGFWEIFLLKTFSLWIAALNLTSQKHQSAFRYTAIL